MFDYLYTVYTNFPPNYPLSIRAHYGMVITMYVAALIITVIVCALLRVRKDEDYRDDVPSYLLPGDKS